MVKLTTTNCWCGIEHAVPTPLYEQAMNNRKQAVFCPLGHQWVFRGESEADQQRRRAERAEQEKARLTEELNTAVANRVKADKALQRHKKRSAAGICPCCNRSFSNMARHMKTEHPDYNVVPLKGAQ